MVAPHFGPVNSLGRDTIPMVDSPAVTLLVCSLLGFLAGLGVGGGSLLMLWLTLIVGMDQSVARVINLIFFLPSAVVVSVFRWRQGTLRLKKIWPAMIAGCLAAILFSRLSTVLPLPLLKKLFGFLLLFTGFRELFYRTKPRH